jgi:osmotically-inducible protein OsmY
MGKCPSEAPIPQTDETLVERTTTQRKKNKMKTIVEKTDTEIKNDVLTELKYEPSVQVTDIGVLVKDGTVTLNGFASSYGEKMNAVRAAKRVTGVNGIADDIKVKLPNSWERDDGEIAAAAANQIEWSTAAPKGAAKVTVSNGWITLEGEVEWWYQKNDAETGVRHLTGVKGVTNLITIKPRISTIDIETAIEEAFERNAMIDADEVEVETDGNRVTLRGKVRNYAERDEAERVAWAAPGVFSVDNKLTVEWFSGWDD